MKKQNRELMEMLLPSHPIWEVLLEPVSFHISLLVCFVRCFLEVGVTLKAPPARSIIPLLSNFHSREGICLNTGE